MPLPNGPTVICGMSPQTAQNYILVRKELSPLIERIHKAGCYLAEFEKIRSTGLCQTLANIGRGLMHDAAAITDYLENEFASLQKVNEAVKQPEKQQILSI